MTKPTGISSNQLQPVEGIELIMEKYSAWASSQDRTGPVTVAVTEISYEKALQSTQFRHKAGHKLNAPEISGIEDIPKPGALTGGALESVELQPPPNEAIENTPEPSRREMREKKKLLVKPPSRVKRKSRNAGQNEIDAKYKQKAQASTANTSENSIGRISMSVRLGVQECEMVKSRAEEAHISISAYLRLCVLEVEAGRRRPEGSAAALPEEHAFSVALKSRLSEAHAVVESTDYASNIRSDFPFNLLKRLWLLVPRNIESGIQIAKRSAAIVRDMVQRAQERRERRRNRAPLSIELSSENRERATLKNSCASILISDSDRGTRITTV